MSITTRCRCGKSYLLRDDLAGKSFKCKKCGKIVQVPGGLDDLEEDDDEEDLLPVRRRRKGRRSKEWTRAKGMLWEIGKSLPGGVLRGTGLLFAVLGYLAGGLFLVLAGGCLLAVAGGPAGPGAGGAVLFLVMAMTLFLGANAAAGRGLKVSRETAWTGDGSIIAGVLIILLGASLPFLIFWLFGMFLNP